MGIINENVYKGSKETYLTFKYFEKSTHSVEKYVVWTMEWETFDDPEHRSQSRFSFLSTVIIIVIDNSVNVVHSDNVQEVRSKKSQLETSDPTLRTKMNVFSESS